MKGNGCIHDHCVVCNQNIGLDDNDDEDGDEGNDDDDDDADLNSNLIISTGLRLLLPRDFVLSQEVRLMDN